MHPVETAEQLRRWSDEQPLLMIYFSGPHCRVCQDLKPKLEERLQTNFPRLPLLEVDCAKQGSIAAEHGVFSVPTLLMLIEGRETQRWARSFGIAQIVEAVRRPYALLHE